MVLRSWFSTLISAATIPTSLLATFIVLKLTGRSINVITLAGLAFAVGMVVDAKIVTEKFGRVWPSASATAQPTATGPRKSRR
jgi:multidrug efflux pump subunit AcrB